MKIIRRVFSLVLTLLIILSAAIPAFAEDSQITIYAKTKKNVQLYRLNKSGVSTVTITLAESTKNFTIKRSTIKVTPGTAGAALYRLYKNADVKEEAETGKNIRGTFGYSIDLDIAKAGNAKVSYKLNGETYSFKVKVLDYENPIKTFKITGIKNGKNIASMVNNSIHADTIPINTSIKNAKVNVVPAEGWKIKYIEIDDTTTNQYRVLGTDGKMLSGTINWGTLNIKHNYKIRVWLGNDKNDFTHIITYNLHGAKAAA